MALFAVPNLLQKAVTATRTSLESQLQKLLERVNILTTAVEGYVRSPVKLLRGELYRVEEVVEEAEEGSNAQADKLHEISQKQIQMVLDGLATARQLEIYLRCLPIVITKCL
jgi:hypothetical protein